MLLSGFLNPEKTITPEKMKSFCKQDNTATLCKIDVAPNVDLLELPILYYPKLINITLNGKPISYTSVLHDDLLFASIKPASGKTNLIKIKFVGLKWANTISLSFWCLWLGLAIKRAYGANRTNFHF